MESIQQPTVVNKSPFLDYKDQDGFLYKLNQLCVPARSTCLLLIKEAHSSSHGGHFGVQNIMLHPQRYFLWKLKPGVRTITLTKIANYTCKLLTKETEYGEEH